MLCLCSLSNIAACYTGSETTLSWSPIRLSILHWQPEFHKLVASGWLTISGHNNYTNNNFDFQPNWLKWHSKLPANWSLFTFPLLLKYKTNFPVIIFLTQHFTAMISAKLCRHGFSAISHNKRIVGARGHICSFASNIYSGKVVSKDAMFWNLTVNWLLQSGDGTPTRVRLIHGYICVWRSQKPN